MKQAIRNAALIFCYEAELNELASPLNSATLA